MATVSALVSCLDAELRRLGLQGLDVGLVSGLHVDLSTTEIYARASIEAKRRALEAAYTDIVTNDLPEWNQDPGLLTWLAKL